MPALPRKRDEIEKSPADLMSNAEASIDPAAMPFITSHVNQSIFKYNA
jgi:hypothetical protein